MEDPKTIVINLGGQEKSEAPDERPDAIASVRQALSLAEQSVKDITSAQGRTDAYINIADRHLVLHRHLLEFGL